MPGITSNFHEGSRSEYLAHYVFSGFGTSFLVPRQEDFGIDLYCALTEKVKNLEWPVLHYTVQVKSDDDPWVIKGHNAVSWLNSHPLPLFLCVVDRKGLRVRIFQTSPRFHLSSMLVVPPEVTLVPGSGTVGRPLQWDRESWTFPLSAPIASLTVPELSSAAIFDALRAVLQWWASFDVENILRLANGLPMASLPGYWITNEVHPEGQMNLKTSFPRHMTPEQLGPVLERLEEILKLVPTYLYRNGDVTGAMIGAMLLRHLKRTENPFIELKTIELLGEIGKNIGIAFDPANFARIADDFIDIIRQRVEPQIDETETSS